jgi:hypothetical protein
MNFFITLIISVPSHRVQTPSGTSERTSSAYSTHGLNVALLALLPGHLLVLPNSVTSHTDLSWILTLIIFEFALHLYIPFVNLDV